MAATKGHVVLDTCAVVWWTLAPTKLSQAAVEVCGSLDRRAPAVVSSISIWEIGLLARRGRIRLGVSLSDYVNKLHKAPAIDVIPVDAETWVANVELDWPHADPADRTIVALAKSLGARLVTSDREIRDFYPLAIW